MFAALMYVKTQRLGCLIKGCDCGGADPKRRQGTYSFWAKSHVISFAFAALARTDGGAGFGSGRGSNAYPTGCASGDRRHRPRCTASRCADHRAVQPGYRLAYPCLARRNRASSEIAGFLGFARRLVHAFHPAGNVGALRLAQLAFHIREVSFCPPSQRAIGEIIYR